MSMNKRNHALFESLERGHDMNTSKIESPVAFAWRKLNAMTKTRKGVAPTRAQAIALLVKHGVHPGTAAVQYHKWLREATSIAA